MMCEARFALVRGVPGTYGDCIRPPGFRNRIDVALAREQHQAYCDALLGLGLSLIEIDADDRFPDCCFVEDTAMIAGGKAVIARMGAESKCTRKLSHTLVSFQRVRSVRVLTSCQPPRESRYSKSTPPLPVDSDSQQLETPWG